MLHYSPVLRYPIKAMAKKSGVSLNSFFVFNSSFGPREGEVGSVSLRSTRLYTLMLDVINVTINDV